MSDTTSISSRKLPWWLNPYLAMVLAILFVPAAEILLKRGAMATAANQEIVAGLGLNVLSSRWTWLAIACYIANFVCWLHALRYLPLYLAFSLLSSTHALVPLGCWWFLGEKIGPGRWAGIAIVLLGVMVIAGSAIKAEQRL
jgi:drug/metabolite transporter (DMT)-like permease